MLTDESVMLDHSATLQEVRTWLQEHQLQQQNFYIVADQKARFKGIISSSEIFNLRYPENTIVATLIQRKPHMVKTNDSLKKAVEIMAQENLDVLPVINNVDHKITGVLSYKNILSVYLKNVEEHQENITISLKRRTLKILLHGKKGLSILRNH